MNVSVDRPVTETSGSSTLPDVWAFGLTVNDDASLGRPRMRPYSYLSECECPDDCLRDHENE